MSANENQGLQRETGWSCGQSEPGRDVIWDHRRMETIREEKKREVQETTTWTERQRTDNRKRGRPMFSIGVLKADHDGVV